ncbi:DUF4209 domain-containing protein [Phenylobacterium sp. LH3H17]|uniref:DUF4209 domain-containing protein n=1 Tax=Phenylobacterium sp. LH3H17 TaxID=2903901 RepID=UPI0020C960B1|nr:DUF4209 domain-containing protein [Phenylobacterium sp. LH3H17]UTP39248.1 DUF4209 domain-containing protein [Phenylobacterium sp. LH3H17]
MSENSTTSSGPEPRRFVVDVKRVPPGFPTQAHSSEFWEALGRTVATFGFLENVLGKAVFAITGTTELPEDPTEAETALKAWSRTLERALTDALGGLIQLFATAVRANSNVTTTNIDELLDQLKQAANLRNVLCHGFWQLPDASGRSVPFFVNRKIEAFASPIDVQFLTQTREATLEMALSVINVVTHMGFQFPSTGGPGEPVWAV